MQLASSNTLLKKLYRSEILVVFYYTEWCKRCIRVKEELDKLENKYGNTIASFIKVDMDVTQGFIDNNTDLEVLRVPYVMLFWNQQILWEGAGTHCAELEEHLSSTILAVKQLENL